MVNRTTIGALALCLLSACSSCAGTTTNKYTQKGHTDINTGKIDIVIDTDTNKDGITDMREVYNTIVNEEGYIIKKEHPYLYLYDNNGDGLFDKYKHDPMEDGLNGNEFDRSIEQPMLLKPRPKYQRLEDKLKGAI